MGAQLFSPPPTRTHLLDSELLFADASQALIFFRVDFRDILTTTTTLSTLLDEPMADAHPWSAVRTPQSQRNRPGHQRCIPWTSHCTTTLRKVLRSIRDRFATCALWWVAPTFVLWQNTTKHGVSPHVINRTIWTHVGEFKDKASARSYLCFNMQRSISHHLSRSLVRVHGDKTFPPKGRIEVR